MLTELYSEFVVSSRTIHDAGKPAIYGQEHMSNTKRSAILKSPVYPESGRNATAYRNPKG